jgi:hypothetical protein
MCSHAPASCRPAAESLSQAEENALAADPRHPPSWAIVLTCRVSAASTSVICGTMP